MLNDRKNIRNMTSGNIYNHLISCSVPLFIGSLFQMLYNIVDSIVVGRYIGSEALAAVGSTGMIINILVYFFLGFSVGAGVLLGQCFGANDEKKFREAVQTTISLTMILCVVLSVVGYFIADPMLRLIHTPENVFADASQYLRIYFLGISSLLVYNIGGQIFRSVGNTSLPLFFLIFSSVGNIFLDIVFVLVFKRGVDGVAWATVISQTMCSVSIIMLMSVTKEIYRLEWRGIHINREQAKTIFSIGIPTGLQSIITALTNLTAQRYINTLGSACMAGWGCFNKFLNIAMLPTGALANATTTFVSQNKGAENYKRISEGIFKSNILNIASSAFISVLMFIFAAPLTSIYTSDEEVVKFGVIFMKWIILSVIYYSVGNNVTSAIIGLGDSKGPTRIKLVFYVGMRLALLVLISIFIPGNPVAVALAFPISWGAGTLALFIYYVVCWRNKIDKDFKANAKETIKIHIEMKRNEFNQLRR